MQHITSTLGAIALGGLTYRIVNFIIEKERNNYKVVAGQMTMGEAIASNVENLVRIPKRGNQALNAADITRKVSNVYNSDSEDAASSARQEFPSQMRVAEKTVAMVIGSQDSEEAKNIVDRAVVRCHSFGHQHVKSFQQAVEAQNNAEGQIIVDVAKVIKKTATQGIMALERSAIEKDFSDDIGSAVAPF